MEPNTKKGLIIGGSVLAVALLCTGLGLGLYYGLNGSKGINVWGYDDQVSSTAKKVNYYMGADFVPAANIYGGEDAMSAEPTMLANKLYHSVQEDIDILDGVKGSKDGLGYLSSTWVMGTSGFENQFTMLKAFNAEAEWANATPENYANPDNYLDPSIDEDKLKYVEMNPSGEYDQNMAATLNIHMKIPKVMADEIRPFFTTGTVTFTEATEEYRNWLVDEEFVDEFVLALGFMKYISTDISTIEEMNSSALAGTSESGTAEFAETDIEALEALYTELGGTSTSFIDSLVEQQGDTVYSIKVDGTGTNSGAMNLEIDNFEADFNDAAGTDLDFKYSLTNGGSGEGWKVPTETTVPETEYPGKDTDANADAFLGTQSRGTKFKDEGGEVSGEALAWGYEAADNGGTNSFVDGKYVAFDAEKDGDIIGYTMAVDLPVFFVNADMSFNYEIQDAGSLAMIENATSEKEGDKVTVKPTAITPEGAKEIYQNGISWTTALDEELIMVEIV